MKRSGGENIEGNTMQLKRARYEEVERSLLERVVTYGEVFLPRSVTKYNGCYKRLKHKIVRPWKVTFDGAYTQGVKIANTRHATEEAAIEHIKRVNWEQGWRIKNLIYKYQGELYTLLSRAKLMKFSEEHIDLVEDHLWWAARNERAISFTAVTSIPVKEKKGGVTTKSFPQLMFPDATTPLRHINANSLDNTVDNIDTRCT